jgi:alkanesulfonate monooxygenase SsuD/methylene tetrahydromethanopterin reductase-like flavin-dependent oxidoreductase (luciferase family)
MPCTQDPPRGENVAAVVDEIVAEAQAIEEAGFDGCFLPEHHQQEDGYLSNALIVAGLIGMKTERIDVGTCATVLPLIHPIHLAEDSAIIDQATKGRLILSVGIGYQQQDFEAFGVNVKQRVGRTEEGIAILRQCWQGERFSFDGKYFQFDDVLIAPKPYHETGPPIWMGSWSPPGIDRAARLADGWLSDPLQSLPVVRKYTDQYRAAATGHGRTPYVVLMRDAVIAGSREEALAQSGPIVDTHRQYYDFGVHTEDEYLKDVKRAEDLTVEHLAKERVLFGSPEDCLEQLKQIQDELNPDYLILRTRFGGEPPHAQTLRTIELIGQQVLPGL